MLQQKRSVSIELFRKKHCGEKKTVKSIVDLCCSHVGLSGAGAQVQSGRVIGAARSRQFPHDHPDMFIMVHVFPSTETSISRKSLGPHSNRCEG